MTPPISPARTRQVFVAADLEGPQLSFVLLHELGHVLLGHLDRGPARQDGGHPLMDEVLCDALASMGALGLSSAEPCTDLATAGGPILDAFLPVFRGHEDGKFRLTMAAVTLPLMLAVAEGEVAHAA